MTKPLGWIAAIVSAINLLITSAVWSAVEWVEIVERGPLAEGIEFGPTGAYERLKGRLHFAVDPNGPANQTVVDLQLAPRDERGLVTFSADFILLRPANLGRGNHRLLYEVNNRGNLGMLSMFNGARHSNDPLTLADAGDGFLLREGYSLLWSAWNWDVLPGDNRLQIDVPIASEAGRALTGPLAAELVVNRPTVNAPFMWGFSRGYPPLSLDDPTARLTVRDEPDGVRTEIARDAWRFARWEDGSLVPDPTRVFYDQGFVPGRIYEVVYTARDPRVVGLGLAAIRDAISFFRFADADAEGTPNPLTDGGQHDPEMALAFGISQSGRVLQHMLWQGFHVDEAGRMVFDGAFIHVAGAGKGSFNHRFAQTTRHPSHLEDHQYPADVFPFTTTHQIDPVTGAEGNVLATAHALEAVPRLFYTTTSTEYWTRAASLLHTGVEGRSDVELDLSARLYFFAGAQHGNWRSAERWYQNCINPLDHHWPMRALLLALDAWVSEGQEPPPSVYPTLANGTLGSTAEYRASFPDIPGVRRPEGHLQPSRLDLGPRFATNRIVDKQPAVMGRPFVTRVPLSDPEGHDRGGIRLPRVAAPLGTHTGWNLRRPEMGAPDKLARWSGSFIPFAATEDERRASGDPRPSLEVRYTSRSDYVTKVRAAAEDLVKDRLLLPSDVAAIVAEAEAFYDRVRQPDPTDLSCAYTVD